MRNFRLASETGSFLKRLLKERDLLADELATLDLLIKQVGEAMNGGIKKQTVSAKPVDGHPSTQRIPSSRPSAQPVADEEDENLEFDPSFLSDRDPRSVNSADSTVESSETADSSDSLNKFETARRKVIEEVSKEAVKSVDALIVRLRQNGSSVSRTMVGKALKLLTEEGVFTYEFKKWYVEGKSSPPEARF